MSKFAILILADTHDGESLGRVVNGLISAHELATSGHEVKVIFDGAGTIGLAKVSDPKHDYHKLYVPVKDHVAACSYCANAFEQKATLEQRSITLLDEHEGHPSFAKLASAGYQIVSF